MAASLLVNAKNALYYCSNDHVGSETASTDVIQINVSDAHSGVLFWGCEGRDICHPSLS